VHWRWHCAWRCVAHGASGARREARAPRKNGAAAAAYAGAVPWPQRRASMRPKRALNNRERLETAHPQTRPPVRTKRLHPRPICVTAPPTCFSPTYRSLDSPRRHGSRARRGGAHACRQAAIQYRRNDGVHDERAPVNLASLRESGPVAFKGQLELDGEPIGFRATLGRCGASKNSRSATARIMMLVQRNRGACERQGPTRLRSATVCSPSTTGQRSVVDSRNWRSRAAPGVMVSRVTAAKLCRCGGSATKPVCDGPTARIGFKST